MLQTTIICTKKVYITQNFFIQNVLSNRRSREVSIIYYDTSIYTTGTSKKLFTILNSESRYALLFTKVIFHKVICHQAAKFNYFIF